MMQHILIRRLSAGLLLLFFALSITPRQVLHDLFANHNDSSQQLSKIDSKGTQLSKAGTHCQCLHLVVENPFTEYSTNIDFTPHILCSEKAFIQDVSFYTTFKPHPSLRGPPSLA